MQQFYSSISFCIRHFGYLSILCIPIIVIEVSLANLFISLNIGDMSDSAVLEALSNIYIPLLILVVLSLILSVALSGGSMIAFRSLSLGSSISPYQALYTALKKFFPLLWGNLLHSIAYGIGFIMLIFPGFYLFARLGLFPLYIMFEDKGAMDSLSNSWTVTDEFGMKLFVLTSVFLGIQIFFGLMGSIISLDLELWFLILATIVKYATLMPLFYLFYSLYESVKTNQ
tara:strand:- start:445 stop:1128 length:684 start_codon:yes stop_codon:yes gene_type:complete